MPISYEIIPLSASVDGSPIAVAATGTPGTLIHTAGAGTINCDLVYLWAVNTSSSAVLLTLEWTGAADGNKAWVGTIPAQSQLPIALKFPAQNAKVIRAFAASQPAINIIGHVVRKTV